jgi:hypothetical protein
LSNLGGFTLTDLLAADQGLLLGQQLLQPLDLAL